MIKDQSKYCSHHVEIRENLSLLVCSQFVQLSVLTLLEDWVEQELPGRGPQGGVQLQAAEDQVPEGGGDGRGNLGWSGSARNLEKYFFTKIFFVEIFLSKIFPYPEYKREMIGNIRCSPWRFACDHLNDAAAEGPDITGPAVAVSSENLRRHEGDCSLKLSLELSRHGGL